MIRVLLVGQFSGISPYELQQHPIRFEALVAEALAEPSGYRKPQVLDVEEGYRPPFATTVLRAGADGQAEVWKYYWDSSD